MNENPYETSRATPDATPQPDSLSRLEDQIGEALSAGNPAFVMLSRVTGTGRQPVEKVGADAFDAFTVGARHGPGRYFAILKVNGRYAASAMFEAAGSSSPPPAPQPAAPASSELSTKELFLALMTMQQQAQQSMTQMMTAMMSRDNGLSPRDILPLLAKSGKGGDVAELVSALRELDGLRGDAGGGDGNELGALLSAIPALAAMRQEPPAPRPAPRPLAPAPRPAPRPMAPAPRPAAPAPQPATPAPQPATPAPQPATPDGDDTGSRILRNLHSVYRGGLSPRVGALAALDVIDTQEDGETYAALLQGLDDAALVNELSARCAAFAEPRGSSWATAALAELRELLSDDGGGAGDGVPQPADGEGINGDEEGDEEGGDEEGGDEEAAAYGRERRHSQASADKA